VYHTNRADRSEPGFPDLVMIQARSAHGPGAIVFAELKVGRGKLTRDQAMWLDIIRSTGQCEAYLWHWPADWERIVDRLTRKVHHAHPG
jgi:hypothetical protein